jgi:hypothetical protein
MPGSSLRAWESWRRHIMKEPDQHKLEDSLKKLRNLGCEAFSIKARVYENAGVTLEWWLKRLPRLVQYQLWPGAALQDLKLAASDPHGHLTQLVLSHYVPVCTDTPAPQSPHRAGGKGHGARWRWGRRLPKSSTSASDLPLSLQNKVYHARLRVLQRGDGKLDILFAHSVFAAEIPLITLTKSRRTGSELEATLRESAQASAESEWRAIIQKRSIPYEALAS